MRILTAASAAAITAFALAACQPAAEEKTTAAEPQQPIESTSAPAMGGPTELPRDGGVTPTPEAMGGASAADVGAAVSPDQAAVLGGGEQNKQ